jgi:pyrimidine operon attenuation protein/uracil phosphoribosyltransferase
VLQSISTGAAPVLPQGYRAKASVLGPDDVRRALTRVAHEVVERNRGLDHVVVVGLARGGVPIAEAVSAELARIEGQDVQSYALDVSGHRDDRPPDGRRRPALALPLDVSVEGQVVVLVDDVLFTGRTVRAALDALVDRGRPACVQLAVLVDRGHRELPIRPDFVGKNLPTRRDELVVATLAGVQIAEPLS